MAEPQAKIFVVDDERQVSKRVNMLMPVTDGFEV